MENYSLDLEVLNQKQEKFPGPTIAQIFVKTYSTDKGTVYITPQCQTLVEIEYQCDRLVKEIESIKRKAKKILEK